jgi:hypothetical protein
LAFGQHLKKVCENPAQTLRRYGWHANLASARDTYFLGVSKWPQRRPFLFKMLGLPLIFDAY